MRPWKRTAGLAASLGTALTGSGYTFAAEMLPPVQHAGSE